MQGISTIPGKFQNTGSAIVMVGSGWYGRAPTFFGGRQKSASSALPSPGRKGGSDAVSPGKKDLLTGGMNVYESDAEDGKLSVVYCGFCGSKLGQLESPVGRAGFYCPKCREDFIAVLKEESLTFRKSRRAKRQVPVNA